jgi:hypothetical protein
MSIKRKFPSDMKIGSFWLNEVEKTENEIDTMNIVLRELSRIEGLVGITSVILLINIAVTLLLIFAVVWGSIQSGPVDMMQAKQAVGILKSLTGGK